VTKNSIFDIPIVHFFSLIAKGLTRIGDARLRPLGFATAQLPVLAGLNAKGALSQAELARLAKVEQPSMAQLLARMERDGIIRRDADPNDRRSSLIVLTDKARAKLPAGRTVLQKSNSEITAGFSAKDAETFLPTSRRWNDDLHCHPIK
jgi:MarR family transcriptional regulator, transcriptional regulator for hemolysin